MGKDEKTEFKKPELLDDILQETEELISACPKSSLFVISTEGRNRECQYYQRDKISRYARNDSLTNFSNRH